MRATRVAEILGATVVERDRAGTALFGEIELLKQSGLRTLVQPAAVAAVPAGPPPAEQRDRWERA